MAVAHDVSAHSARRRTDLEALSPLEVALLCVEDGGTPMHTGALLTFVPRRPVRAQRIVALLRERAERGYRLMRRVRSRSVPPGGAAWVADPSYDPDWHVRHRRLAPPGGHAQLDAYVSRVMSVPLDRRRPLWQVHVITGREDGSLTVLFKCHHAVADGVATLRIIFGELLDHDAGPTPEHGEDVPAQPAAGRRPPSGVLAVPGRLLDTGLDALRGVSAALTNAWQAGRIASTMVGHTRWLAPAVLPAGIGTARRLATTSLPYDDVRRIRERHQASVNDVLLAVLTGAFRCWLRARGTPVVKTDTVRALIPVNHRCPACPETDGNHLSGYLCDLPIGVGEPDAQLRAVRSTMAASKTAGPLRGAGAFPVLADRLPNALHRMITPLASRGTPLLFDTVIASARAPSSHATLDGTELRELYPFLPIARAQSLSIGMLTHHDSVDIGLTVDRTALPDADALAAAVPDSLKALHDAT